MNRKPPVVVVENELLAGRGAVEPELAARDDLGARPGAQPLCLRPSVEGLERDVHVLELLGYGRRVQGGPAARPVRVVDRDRDLRSCGEVAGVPRLRSRDPDVLATRERRVPDRRHPRRDLACHPFLLRAMTPNTQMLTVMATRDHRAPCPCWS